MIADDNATNLKLLHDVLQGAGFTVLTAGSGAEALSVMKTTKIDFLLPDLNMPNMNGLTLMAESKKQNKDLPGMIYTAMDAPLDLVQLAKEKLGVDLVGDFSLKVMMDIVMQKFKEASEKNLRTVNQIK